MEMNAKSPPPYEGTSGNPEDRSEKPPPTYPPPPMAQPGPTPVVMAVPRVIAVGPAPMGSGPQSTTCRSCNAEIVTEVRFKNATKTHIFAAVLCIFGCWCCACIPYCMDSCKNIDHYCPNCNSYLGTYNDKLFN